MCAPLRHADWRATPLLCLAAVIAGLFTNRAIASVPMIVLCGYVLLAAPLQTFRMFLSDRVLIALTLVFFVYVGSAINSTSDKAFLLERLRIKLPFLALPVCYAYLKNRLHSRQVFVLLYFFVFLASFMSLRISLNLLLHQDRMVQLYQMGQTIETPYHHTRYSLMVAFAFLAAIYLWQKNFVLWYRWERIAQLLAAAFLFVFLHLLAVRSGLLTTYLCLFYLLIRRLWHQRNFTSAIVTLLGLILVPVAAYLMMPTLRAKVSYMRDDLNRILAGEKAFNYSDAGRLASIAAGWQLFAENWLTGTGIGDLKTEMQQKLGNDTEAARLNLPHNQFIFVAAGTGVFGLIIFILAVFLPLLPAASRQNWLFVCFNLILLTSFLFEATVEEQIGTAFYLVFLLLGHTFLNQKEYARPGCLAA
ncbi:MAG: O-antigen ligase family protein [Chitinophagales bacterium]|nr:O-antigen ligase family protein [Chitinophagales bacterium]MDW8427158.1 O-antigen ligase family protein [Chitinophagales bacterium]